MSVWVDAVPAGLVSFLLLVVPGGLLGRAIGLRGLPFLALAGPLSVALIGTTGVVAGALGVPFNALPLLAITVLAMAAGLALRRVLRQDDPLRRHERRTVALVAIASITAGLIAAIIAYRDVASPDLMSQTYDGVFHLNAVASILQNSDASSFHLYRMTHPGDGLEFYPAAWHGLVALTAQLTGASVAVSVNVTWVATTAAVVAGGSAWLAVEFLPDARRGLVAVVAALASTASAAGPYLLLQWGVLYPTGLAYALLPSGLALTVVLFRRRAGRTWILPGALLTAWFIASAFAHPRSLISYAVLVAPLLLLLALRRLRLGLADPVTRRRALVLGGAGIAGVVGVAAVGAFALLRYFQADVRPISDRLNGGPATARQSVLESVGQALLLSPPVGPGGSALAAAVVVGAAVMIGVLVCATRAEARWAALAYLLVIVLYALAAGSNEDFAKLATGLWYKDKFRLFALLGVLAPVFVAATVDAVERWVGRHRESSSALPLRAASVAAALLLVLAWASPSSTEMSAAIARNYTVTDAKDGRLLDTAELQLMRELPRLVPEDAVIVGDPWNGSGMTWALGGRESLFPHLTGMWDADRWLVLERLDLVATDPEVCDALDRLGAHYLFASDGLLWEGDPGADPFAAVSRAADAPGFETIAQRGGSRLLRITACD